MCRNLLKARPTSKEEGQKQLRQRAESETFWVSLLIYSLPLPHPAGAV